VVREQLLFLPGPALPVFPRGNLLKLPEKPGQIISVTEIQLLCNTAEGLFCGKQPFFDFLKKKLFHIILQPYPRILAETAGKDMPGDSQRLGYLGNTKPGV
jgi:hypothetical protein